MYISYVISTLYPAYPIVCFILLVLIHSLGHWFSFVRSAAPPAEGVTVCKRVADVYDVVALLVRKSVVRSSL